MGCRECEWIEVSNYKFDDNTQSIVCTRFNKFLGFTNKKGKIRNIKVVNECSFNNSDIEESDTYEKKESGVRGITWDKNSKSWRVMIWQKKLKKYKHIGFYKDLIEAKNALYKEKGHCSTDQSKSNDVK